MLPHRPAIHIDPLRAGPASHARDRRAVSLRWLGAHVLVAATGSGLMLGALAASLQGVAMVPDAAVRSGRPVTRLDAEGVGAEAAVRGDRRVRDEMVVSDKESFSARVSQATAGERTVVRLRPFVQLATNLATTASHADAIPTFDPVRLFDPDAEPERPGEAADAASGAEVTLALADLAGLPVPEDAPALDDAAVDALVGEQARLGAAGEQAAQRLLSRALAAPRAGDGAPEADPFHAIEVRVIPENVTAIAKAEAGRGGENRDLVLGRDETLAAALRANGADGAQAEAILAALSQHARSELAEGQHLRLLIAPGARPGEPRGIRRVILYGASGIEEVAAARDGGGFVAVAAPPRAGRPAAAEAEDGGLSLHDSLYETVLRNDLPGTVADDLVRIFGLGLDLERPVTSADRLEVLYSPAEDGAAGPEIRYAALRLGGESHRAYRFEDGRGGSDYFDDAGRALRRFLLRKPIAEGRITSPFGTRFHPILGYAKFHNGIDWASRAGTPILATGDGIVAEAEPHGGYGNRVEIRHANGYETAYNHMLRFARGIARGARVRQGQVIGYIGSTGLSTGPHVHYEVQVNGRFVDPMKIRLPGSRTLDGSALAQFRQQEESTDALRRHTARVSAAQPL